MSEILKILEIPHVFFILLKQEIIKFKKFREKIMKLRKPINSTDLKKKYKKINRNLMI